MDTWGLVDLTANAMIRDDLNNGSFRRKAAMVRNYYSFKLTLTGQLRDSKL